METLIHNLASSVARDGPAVEDKYRRDAASSPSSSSGRLYEYVVSK